LRDEEKMRRLIVALIITAICIPSLILAEENFLEAPIIPGAKVVKKTETRLELKINKSHDEVVAFYKSALKGLKDVRYREWKKATYIEDDSNRPWHSITISKPEGDEGTTVVILKDNWTWIMGTLILRFIGVFVVLLVLFVAMSLSGAVISRLVKRFQVKEEASKG